MRGIVQLSVRIPDQIADGALLQSFLTGAADFTGGVYIAADADHRDGPLFGPPGVTVTASRRDVNDMYILQSPTNAANTVMVMLSSSTSI